MLKLFYQCSIKRNLLDFNLQIDFLINLRFSIPSESFQILQHPVIDEVATVCDDEVLEKYWKINSKFQFDFIVDKFQESNPN
jgi:hypothetical protein